MEIQTVTGLVHDYNLVSSYNGGAATAHESNPAPVTLFVGAAAGDLRLLPTAAAVRSRRGDDGGRGGADHRSAGRGAAGGRGVRHRRLRAGRRSDDGRRRHERLWRHHRRWRRDGRGRRARHGGGAGTGGARAPAARPATAAPPARVDAAPGWAGRTGTADAGANDAGVPPGMVVSGGCSCHTGRSGGGLLNGALLASALVLTVRRRRRSP